MEELLYVLMIRAEKKSYHGSLIGKVEYVNGKQIFSSLISLSQ